MEVEDKRTEGTSTIPVQSLEPGTVLYLINRYLILSDDIDIAIDLETGEIVKPPREVFHNQILNHTKLVVE